MKKLIFIISLMAPGFLFTVSLSHGRSTGDSVQVWCSPDLEGLATGLMNAYLEEVPDAKIGMTSYASNEYSSGAAEKIGIISKSFFSEYGCESSWRLPIGRDIIIPVMNQDNPCKERILSSGLSRDELQKTLTDSGIQTWGNLNDSKNSNKLKCILLASRTSEIYLSEFLKSDIATLNIQRTNDRDEFIRMLRENRYSLGFCNLADIIEPENQNSLSGITLVPIDVDGNHVIDYFEDIYATVPDLERGVWIGKYPKELYSGIYAVTDDYPTGQTSQNFLRWILTGGQDYLHKNGVSELTYNERKSRLETLATTIPATFKESEKPEQAVNVPLVIILSLIVLTTLIAFVLNRVSNAGKVEDERVLIKQPLFGENTVKVPGGIFFDKSHTWAFMEKEGIVRTGIDDFIQHVTGKITGIKSKRPGDKLSKGETFITLIQEGKQLDLKSPVSGVIIENNPMLKENPSLLNTAPFEEGWVYTIKSMSWMKELRVLLLGENYNRWLRSEFSRLKDFLALKIKSGTAVRYQPVLQEGGELKDGIMEFLGPEIWEEFQVSFINQSI